MHATTECKEHANLTELLNYEPECSHLCCWTGRDIVDTFVSGASKSRIDDVSLLNLHSVTNASVSAPVSSVVGTEANATT